MERNDKLKEIDIKNPTCYYFGEKTKIEDFDFDIFFLIKNHRKIFRFMTFHAKL